MNTSQFLTQLLLVTLISVALVFGLNFNPQIASGQAIAWITIMIFVVFSGVVYFVSSYAARQANKNFYSSVILLAMMTRMLICFIIVFIYAKTIEPTSNHFLIPFFSIYILYTIFEVHFMTRIGNYDGVQKNDG